MGSMEGDMDFPNEQLVSQNTGYNVSTSNKYDILSDATNITINNTEIEDDFVKELKKKNMDSSGNTLSRNQSPSKIQSQVTNRNGKSLTLNKNQVRDRKDSKTEGNERKKEEKLPPINILYQDPKDTEILLIKKLGQIRSAIKRGSKNKHSLQVYSANDFYQTKKLLESASTCFYTYTQKLDKPISMILKGLHHTYDT